MTNLPLPLQLLPTMMVTDANLHSPVWNPPHNNTNNKSADDLIDLMTTWDLRLRSPAGVPTYGLNSSTTAGTTIDLAWVNGQVNNIIHSCFVDTEDVANHLSDHQALITSFRTKTQEPEQGSPNPNRPKNWYKVNIPDLLTKLMSTLPVIPHINTQFEADKFDSDLRDAIKTALTITPPIKPHQANTSIGGGRRFLTQ